MRKDIGPEGVDEFGQKDTKPTRIVNKLRTQLSWSRIGRAADKNQTRIFLVARDIISHWFQRRIQRRHHKTRWKDRRTPQNTTYVAKEHKTTRKHHKNRWKPSVIAILHRTSHRAPQRMPPTPKLLRDTTKASRLDRESPQKLLSNQNQHTEYTGWGLG